MFNFEDTRLLRHPTVERAFHEMRTLFSGGDDFARQAVRAGEIITQSAKKPDPDAIAAAVLMDGMVVRFQPASFAASVGPRVAEIMQNMFEFDPAQPVFKSAAEQQIVLAHSIIGLDQVAEEIRSGRVNYAIEYNNVKRSLGANERSLLKIIEKTGEQEMAALAVEKLLLTQAALDDLVRRAQAEIKFENTGLPEHPLVREVYEHMRDWDIDGHPLGGYARTNGAMAKVIVETGASSDPEVLSAALLNQYSTLKEGHRKPEEFSARIGELYEESSPWASLSKGKTAQPPRTAEGKIITDAALVHFMESHLEGYRKYTSDASRCDKTMAAELLEDIEDLAAKLLKAAETQEHSGLQARMQRAASAADALINAPENVAVRKPGSPPRDLAW